MDNILIDGAQLTVCSRCRKYGTVIHTREVHKSPSPAHFHSAPRRPPKNILDLEEILVFDYSKRIQRARSQLGLSQQDLAQHLNEKKSIIAHLELGKLRPSDRLLKKLERTLKIKLKEKLED